MAGFGCPRVAGFGCPLTNKHPEADPIHSRFNFEIGECVGNCRRLSIENRTGVLRCDRPMLRKPLLGIESHGIVQDDDTNAYTGKGDKAHENECLCSIPAHIFWRTRRSATRRIRVRWTASCTPSMGETYGVQVPYGRSVYETVSRKQGRPREGWSEGNWRRDPRAEEQSRSEAETGHPEDGSDRRERSTAYKARPEGESAQQDE